MRERHCFHGFLGTKRMDGLLLQTVWFCTREKFFGCWNGWCGMLIDNLHQWKVRPLEACNCRDCWHCGCVFHPTNAFFGGMRRTRVVSYSCSRHIDCHHLHKFEGWWDRNKGSSFLFIKHSASLRRLMHKVLHVSVWSIIGPMLDTDDVIQVRVVAKRWHDGRRYGKIGKICFQLLHSDPFVKQVECDRVAELMMIKFSESGHPVFGATSPFVPRSVQKQRWWKIINTLLRWWGNDWNCFSHDFFC